MRTQTFTSSMASALLFGGTLGVATAANAATTTILNLATAGAYGSVTKNATVGSQSNVTTLGGPFAVTWGSATGGTRPGSTQTSGFGMQASGNAGVGGWAGTQGALLSDITGASFDWYNAAGGLGGGFRLYMDVYSPTAQGNNRGYLQFDLSYLLPSQTGGQWNSTGNYLAGAAGSAWYSPISGSNPMPPLSGGNNYQTWAQIQTTLAGWSVMQIGIINDSGMTVSINNFSVTSVPAPGAAALIGLAGMVATRRRRN